MKVHFKCIILITLLLSTNASTTHAHNGGATAYAIPLKGIIIDGKLDDWPDNMVRYPILNNRRAYGPTDIDFEDLTTNSDLSPNFMVGFNQKENLIYLAVRVQDDSLMVGQDNINGDSCEVYVDGTHCGKKYNVQTYINNAEDYLGQFYVLCPPGGYRRNFSESERHVNPDIKGGDITKTRTHGICIREGNITIYEWAIEVFDHYPDSTTKLKVGKTIGFDAVIVDKDKETDTAWVSWAPFGVKKLFNLQFLGDLVFLEDYSNLGTISGKVIDKRDNSPWHGVEILIEDSQGNSINTSPTNTNGEYHLWVMPGEYRVSVKDARGIDPFTVYVRAGKHDQDIDFTPTEVMDEEIKSLVEIAKNDNRMFFTAINDFKYYRETPLNFKLILPTFTKLFKYDKNLKVRSAALKAIGILSISNININEANFLLKEALKNNDENIRLSAAEAFSQAGMYSDKNKDREVINTLIETLNDKDSSVRSAVADALGSIGSSSNESVVSLINSFKREESPQVRSAIARALGNIGPKAKAGIPILIEALKDNNPDVRVATSYAFQGFGADAKIAIPALIEALDDNYTFVRSYSAQALGKIGPDAKAAVIPLLKKINDDDKGVRINSILALGNIGTEAKPAVPSLIKLLNDDDDISLASTQTLGNIGIDAKTAIPSFIEKLLDKNTKVDMICMVIRALGNMKYEAVDAIPYLVELLKSEHQSVRFCAAGSLNKISLSLIDVMKNIESAEIKSLIKQLINTKNEFDKADILSQEQYFDYQIYEYVRSEINKGTSVAINGAIMSLKTEYDSRLFTKVNEWIINHGLHKNLWVWIIGLYLLWFLTRMCA